MATRHWRFMPRRCLYSLAAAVCRHHDAAISPVLTTTSYRHDATAHAAERHYAAADATPPRDAAMTRAPPLLLITTRDATAMMLRRRAAYATWRHYASRHAE
jgi:hypothetical protein